MYLLNTVFQHLILIIYYSHLLKQALIFQVLHLEYQEIKSTCGGDINLELYNNSSSEISSPNYPNIPESHIECDWTIRAPPGETIRIDFEERFDLTISKE